MNEADRQRIIQFPDPCELVYVILLEGGAENFSRAKEGFDDHCDEQVDKHVATDDLE